jgi:isopropylmalate/homocitrate/citramalate synthase
MGDQVTLYEVGPRDGLQNEAVRVPIAGKLRLIEALARAGLGRIEIGSFVRPDRIPQLADTDEEARRLLGAPAAGKTAVAPSLPDVRFSALVPNRLGLERASAAGLREVAVFMSASESHNRKNTDKSIAESLREFEQMVPAAVARGLTVRGYVSTVWGCPYALANCLAAHEARIRTFDASVGGMGIPTGVDLDKLIDAGALAQELVGRELPGRRLKAALGQRGKSEPRLAGVH